MTTIDDADTEHIPAPAGHAPRLDAIQVDEDDPMFTFSGLGLAESDNPQASVFSTQFVDTTDWR